jgi:plastocyanin
MRPRSLKRVLILFQSISALVVLAVPQLVPAKTWRATVGAESHNLGRQALAFLPNELWVHVDDSIEFTFATEEVHTVTFLQQDTSTQQTRPANTAGCPGALPPDGRTDDPSSFDGSKCVNSGRETSGSYTVTFPTAGNFKVVCLVHANMTGAVHVLKTAEPLPYDQRTYDFLAKRQANTLLADGAGLAGQAVATAEQAGANAISAGIGEVVATGGGSSTLTVMRFLRDSIIVHVGDTVEWTNLDPVTPHTITFGTEPTNTNPASGNVTLASDGARHATINSIDDSVHSGFIQAAQQDRANSPQTALGVTRFRVTFNTPGTFNYICALHDELGMVGKVIVRR